MMRQRERVMLARGLALPSKRRTGLSYNQESVGSRKFSGIDTLLNLQRAHGNAFVQRLVQCNWKTNEGRKGKADLKYAEGVQRNWFCSNLRNLGSSFRGGWGIIHATTTLFGFRGTLV